MQASKGGRVGAWRPMLCLLHTNESGTLDFIMERWLGGAQPAPSSPAITPSFAALLSCGPPHRLGSQSSDPPWVCRVWQVTSHIPREAVLTL